MAEFILDHWQLLASVVLALFNLVLTLAVHAVSTSRFKGASPSSTADALQAILEANSAILEVLNAKGDKQKGEQKDVR